MTTRKAWLSKHIESMKKLIPDVKAALLINMNAVNVSKAINSYECNVNHIQKSMQKLKHFGLLFDYSKQDKVNLKIERGGYVLGIKQRKKIIDPKFIEENLTGWESKYSETLKKLEKTKLIVTEAKSKIEKRIKEVSIKKKTDDDVEIKIGKANNEEDQKSGTSNKVSELQEDDDDDEPKPAGYTTAKQWFEDVINYSKECGDDDDCDDIKFGAAPTFKK